MRKVIVMLVLLAAARACALELPDSVEEWRCVSEHVVPLVLDANGENLGRVIYRDYEREAPKGLVSVILTEGKGTGSLYIPEHVREEQGVMPSESEYKLLDIAGRAAILELHELLPSSLATSVDDNTVLTLESSALDDEALVKFAENILRESKNQ